MCFSLQVSLFAFITCSISCIFLYLYASVEYKCIAIYAFFVSLMQLYDFIFWSTHKKHKYILCILYFTTLGLSFYYIKNLVIGRFWCYFASYIPIILLVFYQAFPSKVQ